MKFSVILSIVGIGIAIGWIAKPAPESEVVQIEQYRKDLEIKSQGILGGMGFGREPE